MERLEERRLDDLGVLARREDLWDKIREGATVRKNYPTPNTLVERLAERLFEALGALARRRRARR